MSATAALIFLPFVLPICLWVAWSDMKFMRIPNLANYALALVWLVLGLFLVPLADWAWGIALGLAVLVVGFLANLTRLVGAGDAKFAAAMAPFFLGTPWNVVYILFASCLLGAFAAHRTMRAMGAFRSATPDWASWTDAKFPMGLALAGALALSLIGRAAGIGA
ncbi:prepilin peptidase [Neotabrizicola shimadae]|uniref:Prepilin peptidase n=1 Tax=Neotabrizicola shimadae TaxID=2807096 RepID=A0A8G1EF85_9RHOB|nr:prepilin peptidase [Neotabrizicola shimadae]QYZ71684.1 prepilin peptidase [Neotabrizicola shimadae]